MISRRGIIKRSVGVVVVSSLAGCSGDSSDDDGGSDGGSGGDSDGSSNGGSNAETVLDETVFESEDGIYRFDASQGATISVSASNDEGQVTLVRLYDPNDEMVHEEEVETEGEFSHEAQTGGAWMIQVASFGESSFEVVVEG